jgi:hypothetical protein
MSVNLSPIGNGQQFFDNNGIPLSGGLLYAYQAGSSTPQATYLSINGTVPNANPIVLDASGRISTEVWLTYGLFYKFVLKNANEETIGTYDNIYGIVGVQTAVGTTIPTGMISLWYGSIGSVPTGWYLCDGSNGTPDLRDKFIVGAGSTYAVSATGGSADTVVVSHTHTATSAVTDPGHGHLIRTDPNGGGGGGGNFVNTTSGTSSTFTAATNTTGVSVTTTVASAGVSGTNKNLPPYYALAYVMKA